jgi:hypothetical protein
VYEVRPGVYKPRINKPQHEVLEALAEFGELTAEQLLRKLQMKPGSKSYLFRQLRDLAAGDGGKSYVEVMTAPIHIPFGGAPYVYALGPLGRRYLKRMEYPIQRRYRAREERLHKRIPLEHRLVVNEFLLQAMLLERRNLGVFLSEYLHESYWSANPLKVQIYTDTGETKTVSIAPDLLLDFQIKTPRNQYRFLPEITLSRVSQRRWRQKVRAYCYSLQAYIERFGTNLLTAIPVLVASPTSYLRKDLSRLKPHEQEARDQEAKRCQKLASDLLRWTEAELTKLNLQQEADLFCFSSAPLDEMTPEELFFSAHWVIPFDSTPRPLMPYEADTEVPGERAL